MIPSEEKFVTFLKSLQLDANLEVSLGWLLDDGNPLLLWFYDNISTDNCLTPLERMRYQEILDAGNILKDEELEDSLTRIKDNFNGLTLQTEEENKETEFECDYLQSVVDVLQEQVENNDRLLDQEKKININLLKDLEMTNILVEEERNKLLNSQRDCEVLIDEAKDKKMKYCNMLNEILDNSTKKKCFESILISEHPLELYFEKTKLLQSYLKLYLNRQFENPADQELLMGTSLCGNQFEENTGMHGKIIESCKRLEDSLRSYCDKRGIVEDLHAQIEFINNYEFDQCCDVELEMVKSTSELNILIENLKVISEDEVQLAIDNFIKRKSKNVMLGEYIQNLEKAKYLHGKLCNVGELVKRNHELDTLLFICLSRDLHITQSLLQFSSDALNYLKNDIIANKSRYFDPTPLKCEDFVWNIVKQLLKEEDQSPTDVNKKHMQNITHLESAVFCNQLADLENAVKMNQSKSNSLKTFIWDGPTRQPNIVSSDLNMTLYELNKSHDKTDELIRKSAEVFKDYKNKTEKEPKINKFWMWFLAGKPDEFIEQLRKKLTNLN